MAEQKSTSYGLGVTFLAMAAGLTTERVLERRRVEILQYMAQNKYALPQDEFKSLTAELGEIEAALGKI